MLLEKKIEEAINVQLLTFVHQRNMLRFFFTLSTTNVIIGDATRCIVCEDQSKSPNKHLGIINKYNDIDIYVCKCI